MVAQKLTDRYRSPADLPQRIPVFPLRGTILLPRAMLPLNVFEPRYLQMVEDIMSTSRVLGIVQPEGSKENESPRDHAAPLRRTGCAGRITAYQELDDGRRLITLTGVARFTLKGEVPLDKPYRIWTVTYDPFLADFAPGVGDESVDRNALLTTLKAYLKARKLDADWEAIARSSNEALVNSLSIVSPYGPEEKQALLEAADLRARADILVALAEMEMAAGSSGPGSVLQ